VVCSEKVDQSAISPNGGDRIAHEDDPGIGVIGKPGHVTRRAGDAEAPLEIPRHSGQGLANACELSLRRHLRCRQSRFIFRMWA
jgi:hypothetical protein